MTARARVLTLLAAGAVLMAAMPASAAMIRYDFTGDFLSFRGGAPLGSSASGFFTYDRKTAVLAPPPPDPELVKTFGLPFPATVQASVDGVLAFDGPTGLGPFAYRLRLSTGQLSTELAINDTASMRVTLTGSFPELQIPDETLTLADLTSADVSITTATSHTEFSLTSLTGQVVPEPRVSSLVLLASGLLAFLRGGRLRESRACSVERR